VQCDVSLQLFHVIFPELKKMDDGHLYTAACLRKREKKKKKSQVMTILP